MLHWFDHDRAHGPEKLELQMLRAGMALLCVLLPQPALAQADGAPEWSGNVAAASDHRFRGYSRSDEKPVLMADVEAGLPVAEDTVLFAGGTGSVNGKSRDYGSAQAQLYLGLEQNLGQFRLTLGGRGYLFPDVSDRDYVEFFGSVRTEYGPVSARLGFALAPEQENYGGERGIYLYSDLDSGIPGTPLTLAAHMGWEDNAYFRGKIDWSMSLIYIRNPFTMSIGYVDTNRFVPFEDKRKLRNGADATLVVRLGASF